MLRGYPDRQTEPTVPPCVDRQTIGRLPTELVDWSQYSTSSYRDEKAILPKISASRSRCAGHLLVLHSCEAGILQLGDGLKPEGAHTFDPVPPCVEVKGEDPTGSQKPRCLDEESANLAISGSLPRRKWVCIEEDTTEAAVCHAANEILPESSQDDGRAPQMPQKLRAVPCGSWTFLSGARGFLCPQLGTTEDLRVRLQDHMPFDATLILGFQRIFDML